MLARYVRAHPYEPYDKVKEEVGVTCSRRSVNRVANDAGFRSYPELAKGSLRANQIAGRLRWARTEVHRPLSYWTGNNGGPNAIHFTIDGKTFGKALDPAAQLAGMAGKVKRKKGEGLRPEHLTGKGTGDGSTHKHSVKFMVGIGNGRVTLCEEYKGKITAAAMVPIVRKIPDAIRAAYGHGPPPGQRWVLSQDNDRSQNAAELQSEWTRRRITVADGWPASSGDLRWIENCWASMQRRLYETDPGPHERKADFILRARACILATPAADIWPHVRSMPKRLRECVANGGGRVHY